MKKNPLTILFVAVALLLAGSAYAQVTPPIRSNCPQFYEGYLKYKQYAISCTRTRARQLQLVAYFTKMGRPGQASKNSNHVRGCACDLKRSVTQLPQFRRYNGRGHTGNHYSHTGR